MHALGLDREAAAMLMVESDAPGGAADDELAAAEAACSPPARPRPSAPRTPAEADLLRQARRAAHWALEKARRREDGGRRRATLAGPGHAPRRSSGSRPARRADRDVRARRRRQPPPDLVLERGDPAARPSPRPSRPTSIRPRSTSGGTVTGEHGIGSARREWLEPQRGADAVRVMRAIKTALDPLGLLNPGRVLPTPRVIRRAAGCA